ncbi:MAG: hypothetical protein DHS20C11_06140 [Lysobacteraceae bacterium]|nr:MAG: hypothetical protein DHS20C11_06140 [Xanthomonadaceae bacterium]
MLWDLASKRESGAPAHPTVIPSRVIPGLDPEPGIQKRAAPPRPLVSVVIILE